MFLPDIEAGTQLIRALLTEKDGPNATDQGKICLPEKTIMLITRISW